MRGVFGKATGASTASVVHAGQPPRLAAVGPPPSAPATVAPGSVRAISSSAEPLVSLLVRKGLKQFRMAVKSPRQATRVVASEAKMRLGIPTLRSVEFQVTHACNLRCAFCYAEDIMHAEARKKNIALADFERVLDECHRLGMIHINITGGEPLVRKDIVEFVDAVPKDVVVSLVTNSTLLTRAKIDQLIAAGLSTLQMSYGSNYTDFDRSLAQYCVAQGLSVTLSIVNTLDERPHNERALQLGREDGYNVLFNYPMRYKNNGLDAEFYWQHRYDPMVREDNLFWSGRDVCPAGLTKIYITNDGDIMPCDRIHQTIGNIYSDSIEATWRTMFEEMRERGSFCLLETDAQQWADNNARAGKSFPDENRGSAENPFNVLAGKRG